METITRHRREMSKAAADRSVLFCLFFHGKVCSCHPRGHMPLQTQMPESSGLATPRHCDLSTLAYLQVFLFLFRSTCKTKGCWPNVETNNASLFSIIFSFENVFSPFICDKPAGQRGITLDLPTQVDRTCPWDLPPSGSCLPPGTERVFLESNLSFGLFLVRVTWSFHEDEAWEK